MMNIFFWRRSHRRLQGARPAVELPDVDLGFLVTGRGEVVRNSRIDQAKHRETLERISQLRIPGDIIN